MTSPTQRTLKLLRSQGYSLVEIVEHWNPFARVRKDLFQFIDVLAVRSDSILAVQTTSGSNVSARFEKMRLLPSVTHWLDAPSRQVVIHGWRKVGGRGKRKVWECREVPIVMGATGSPEMLMEGAK